jgi:hypothetical protein
MPWKSKAQERWGNSPAGHKALGNSGVDEWNQASKGKKLPEHTVGSAIKKQIGK